MVIVFRICFCLCLCLTIGSCQSRLSSKTLAQAENKVSTVNPTMEVKIRLVEGISSPWKVTTDRVNRNSELRDVQFTDVNTGWLSGGEGSLYKTIDGGKSWARVKVSSPQDSYVNSVYFINAKLGWVTVAKTSPNILNQQANQIWIMKTVDGGDNWIVQHTEKSVGVSRMIFVNEQEGWIVGIKTTQLRPIHQAHFVLHTNNQGLTWTDVSSNINRTAANKEGRVQDYASDIYALGSSKAVLLSLRGGIFKTDNGGESWQEIAALPDEPEQTCVCRLGITEGGALWVSGGSDGREGKRGMVATHKSDGVWKRFTSDEIYFSDAVYLTDNQVIAIGSITSTMNVHKGRNNGEGIALYSADGGESWTIIYRNKQIKLINQLSVVDSNHIWAIGEDGLVVRLERSTEKISVNVNN